MSACENRDSTGYLFGIIIFFFSEETIVENIVETVAKMQKLSLFWDISMVLKSDYWLNQPKYLFKLILTQLTS